MNVVFVCTGNICRSPIAEKILAAEVEAAGLADRVRVTSAGTGHWHIGQPMDSRAAQVLAEHGHDTAHSARQVDSEILSADLLVALVFLGTDDETLVLTGRLVNLMGSRGGQWEILATSAFVSIVVPLIVFFAMQKYLVRGLLAGSVK